MCSKAQHTMDAQSDCSMEAAELFRGIERMAPRGSLGGR
jgi:hypothetical protein